MKKLVFLFLLIISLTSCKKFLDVNVSPNNAPAVPPATLLPTTTIALAFANSNDLNRVTSALVQHIAGVLNQTQQYDVYNIDGSFDNQWNGEIYGSGLSNLQILIDQYSETSPAYSGIAKLEMAYLISMATDLWGDVPYSQAAKGVKYLFPRFDKQEDIYQGNAALGITSLFDLVKSGIADLSKTSIFKPGADDIVYKGDLTKWAKLGNSLLLKFAIHISNRNPALATTTIQSVIAGDKFINSNALDFDVPFGTSVGNQNAIFTFNNLNRRGDQMLSARLLKLEKNLNDTVRLSKYFTKPKGVFTSFDNGSTDVAPVLSAQSNYNTYLTGLSGEAPIHILTNFQVQFILAESALILGTTGDPNTYYQAGIRANMQKIGIPTDSINLYFSTNPDVVNLTGSVEDMRKQIITQKYIAWIGNGIEAYNDYRRTGYPALTLVNNPRGDNPNVIPTRLTYTLAELSANPNAPKPRPKTDVKLWFAK